MKQEGGDNSTNIQVKGDYNCGLSYSDARQVALDVFKANYYELSKEAMDTVNTRLNYITEKVIERIYSDEKLTDKIINIKEPSIQTSIYEVQKGYVKTGDTNLAEQLTNILVERVQVDMRTLEQIVLDEAIAILPKLTNKQIDILTFLLFAANMSNLNKNAYNIDGFISLLSSNTLSFYHYISGSDSTHLQSCGCITPIPGAAYKPLETIISNWFSGLFNRGFTMEELHQITSVDLMEHIVRCQQDIDKLQFNALNSMSLDSLLYGNSIDDDLKIKIRNLHNSKQMTDTEIKQNIIERNPELNKIFDIWNNGKAKNYMLTPTGIAIGLTNYNIKFNDNLSFLRWIHINDRY